MPRPGARRPAFKGPGRYFSRIRLKCGPVSGEWLRIHPAAFGAIYFSQAGNSRWDARDGPVGAMCVGQSLAGIVRSRSLPWDTSRPPGRSSRGTPPTSIPSGLPTSQIRSHRAGARSNRGRQGQQRADPRGWRSHSNQARNGLWKETPLEKRLMRPRIQQELDMLRRGFPSIEHTEANGEDWFRIPAYLLPVGWRIADAAVAHAPVVFKVCCQQAAKNTRVGDSDEGMVACGFDRLSRIRRARYVRGIECG